jgi:hypothetical protein
VSACGLKCTDFMNWIDINRAFFTHSHLIIIAMKFGGLTDHGAPSCCACSEHVMST